ncbi:MAG: hypothetical protein B7X06_02245 [Verrucomicrobia bacterium 21-51-4]|nr:MAG: hypothetical protein B7X06_02245 [Verrucomicrobia bacterium 21-51-4]HQU09169.1 helix-turn-helix domain-containing protein [Opitutales bacterium]
MQSIGERLSDARKRLGWCIREVSEHTKVRGDFLIHFESDEFNFDLPEIYKRGFLKLYAKALKLDAEGMIRDFDEVHAPARPKNPRFIKATERELFGQIELEDDLTESGSQGSAANTDEAFAEDEMIEEGPSSNSRFIKLALGGAAAGVLVWLMVLGIQAWRNPAPEINPSLATTEAGQPKLESIKLVALGDVHVVVRQELDRQKLFSGTLTAGQEVPLEKRGQIKIRFSDGQNILLQKGTKQYAMNAEGMGVRVFD